MTDQAISQSYLRSNVAAVLRAAEAGETFTVTVRGCAAARLGPLGDPAQPRVDVDRETLRRIQELGGDDDDWLTDLRAAEPPG